MWKQARIIVAVLIAVLLIILLVQNRGSVATTFLFATVSMPLAILLLITFLLGLAVGLLWAGQIARKARSKGK
jgi:uncharacterized integral membrane protein